MVEQLLIQTRIEPRIQRQIGQQTEPRIQRQIEQLHLFLILEVIFRLQAEEQQRDLLQIFRLEVQVHNRQEFKEVPLQVQLDPRHQ